MKESKKSTRRLNRIIFVLAIIGILIAIYVFQSFVREAPIVCVNSGCELVRKNPASYLFGFPVPGVGLIGYSIIAFFAFLRTIHDKKLYLQVILGMSTFGVLFVSWFTYTELFVIKAVCSWCAVSAVDMLILWILSIKSYRMEYKKT